MEHNEKFEYSRIPRHLHNGIDRYVNQHIPPGRFLRSVITNDLAAAILHADPDSLAALPMVTLWFYNCAPVSCYGSQQLMDSWAGEKNRCDECKRGRRHVDLPWAGGDANPDHQAV